MSWIEQVPLRRLVRFLADVLISAVASSVLSIIIWGLFEGLGAGWGLLLLMPPLMLMYWLLVYGPFILFLLYGLAKGRPGFVVGPVLLGLAAYALSNAALNKFDAEIAALASEVAEPVRADYAILATEGSNAGCDATCIKILATTEYAMARISDYAQDHQWRVYRVASGQVCFAQDNATLALEFLRYGYPGKCAVKETVADFGEGLVLRTRTVNKFSPAPELPRGFAGTVYELHERTAGRSRLLARRVTGVLESPLPGPLMVFGRRPERLDAGPPIDEKQFLANALKTPVDDLFKRPQPFPFEQVLDEIEKYFGRKEIVDRSGMRSIERGAADAWRDVAGSEGRAHTDALLPRIARLLASDEPIRVATAIRGLSTLDAEKQSFADGRLLELAFVAMPADATSAIRSLLEWRLSPRLPSGRLAVPDEWRERARSRLGDPDVTPAQREVLTLIRDAPL
jgi:hypothetical protein